VSYETRDGSARGWESDYGPISSGSLDFGPGVTSQTLEIYTNSDWMSEGNETFFVNLTGAWGATIGDSQQGLGTIVNVDPEYLTLGLPAIESDGEERQTLTVAEISPLLEEAVARWEAAGAAETDWLGRLKGLELNVADLPDGHLAAVVAGRLWIDVDAAGYGWFVDATPEDDREFRRVVADTERQAVGQSPALDRVDLWTVLTHELGHLLGLADLAPEESPHDIMTETIGLGTRRTPAEGLGDRHPGTQILRHSEDGGPTDSGRARAAAIQAMSGELAVPLMEVLRRSHKVPVSAAALERAIVDFDELAWPA
jgi:hypothetical protein